MNPNRKALTIIVILALAGFVLAVYDFIAHTQGFPLWCPFAGNGCDIVQNSRYAVILGIPLSFFGILGFAAYVVLASVAQLSKATVGKLASEATYFCVYMLLALNIVVLCFLTYFVFLQLTVIHAICSLCMIGVALNLGIGMALVYSLSTRLPRRLVATA